MILPITDDGIRPAGKSDKCFYCGAAIPGEHEAECVLRRRTVVLEMRIKYIAAVPLHWTKEDIEFHRNGSSWCSENDIEEIYEQAKRAGENHCNTCCRTEFSYIEEATEDQMHDWGWETC